VDPHGVERKLAAILSADVVGYSRLMAEDEDATVRTLAAYREEISLLVRQHRGRVVDFTGDNFLAEFPTATDAVQGAVEIQGILKVRNAPLPADRRMEFRIGVHLGEVRTEGERIYGDGVNIAARLEGLAEAGGICISDMVQRQVEGKFELGYQDIGEQTVKNIPKPVRAYRVGIGEVSAVEEPPSTTVRALAGVGAVLVAVAAVAGWWLLIGGPARVEEPVPTEMGVLELPDKPSIAVLPFANMSDDPGQEYFSDGISEDLITDLSRISGLFVIARNSSFVYKDRNVNVEQVGRELGVRYVLEGSVRKADDRVRITAQLVDATTGGHLWADRYDRKLEDIFALQDEVTGKIVDALEVSLTESERADMEQAPTDNLMAYDYFLRGVAYFNLTTKGMNVRAREMFERAIELDPDFSEAYAFLGWTHMFDWWMQWSDDPEKLRQAFGVAEQALVLNDSQAVAHGLVAWRYIYDRDYDKAIAEAEQAVALAPSGSSSHIYLAQTLNFSGRPRDAIPIGEKAMRLDPQFAWMSYQPLSESYRLTGRLEEAISWSKRILQVNPDFLLARVYLASMYAELGRDEEAEAEVSEIYRISPTFSSAEVRRRTPPYKDPAELDRLVSTLRKAGLKE
jgi:adenylate cyclase